ncbi:hypothetical protein ACH3O9_11265 [Leeuwenhoekiella sp. A16]|uniref:hypothetical protein n=1 Tax=Leeuwenhoekiella sp. A16 TaxID=3141462 RepID=UPI003A8062B3
MSEFPLNISPKEDHPSQIEKIKGLDQKYYLSAADINKIFRALTENQLTFNDYMKSGSFPGNADDLKAIFDSAVFDSVKVEDSLQIAINKYAAADPKPADGTIFRVSEITDPDNAGEYSYQSGEANNYRFEKPYFKKSIIGVGLNEFGWVSGDQVFESIKDKVNALQALDLINIASKYEADESIDINGVNNYEEASTKGYGQYIAINEYFSVNKIEAAIYFSASTFNLEARVYISDSNTGDTSNMTLIETFIFDQDNAPIDGTVLTLELSQSLNVEAGNYVYVLVFSDNATPAIRRKNSTDRFLFFKSANQTDFPLVFTFSENDGYGTTGLKLYNINEITKLVTLKADVAKKIDSSQAQKIIKDSSTYIINDSFDLTGTNSWNQPAQKALGQCASFPEQHSFNRVEAAIYFTTSTFNLEARVYTAPVKTGNTVNMTLVETFNYDQDSAPIDGTILTLDLSEPLTLQANNYLYVLVFSDNASPTIRRKNSTDRFLFVNNIDLAEFPTSYSLAVEDSYGTTGLRLYNINNFTKTQQDVEGIGNRVDVLENETGNDIEREIFFSNTLDLIAGEDYTIYKSSIIRNRSEVVKTLISLRENNINSPYSISRYKTGVEDLNFTAKDLSSSAALHLRSVIDLDKNQIIPISVSAYDKKAKSGEIITWLAIGNSLTNRGVAKYTREYNNALVTGIAISNIGTATNSGVAGEGREGWTFLNFVGQSNKHPFTNSVIYSPFLKLATSTDKSNHPEWCFQRTDSASELSLAETTDTGQDFYIFDLSNYLSSNSFDAPTHISLALGTNDITKYGANQANSLLGFEIMLSQIKTALPNVEVGVVTGTAKGDNTPDAYRQNQFDFINAMHKKVADLALTKIKILPVYAFQNGSFIFPYASTDTFLNESGNLTQNAIYGGVGNANIHFDPIGYKPYAQLMLGWILCNPLPDSSYNIFDPSYIAPLTESIITRNDVIQIFRDPDNPSTSEEPVETDYFHAIDRVTKKIGYYYFGENGYEYIGGFTKTT